VRERLGQRVFDECIAQGRTWSLAEAIEKTRRSFASSVPA
jgi:hypothetical protein